MLHQDDLDAEAEAAVSSVLSRFREKLAALPIRPATAESLVVEAGPAAGALLFALTTDRATDTTSLEHHETTAMLALLGRSCAVEGLTPTAAAGVVPALLESFRERDFGVPASLDRSLFTVFLEGFVRAVDDERVRRADARALARLRWLVVAEGVALVALYSDVDPEALGGRLEVLAREAYAGEFAHCIVVVDGDREAQLELASPVLHFAGLLTAVGAEVTFIGEHAEAWARFSGGRASPSLVDATSDALRATGAWMRSPRGIAPLRALFRGLGSRRGD